MSNSEYYERFLPLDKYYVENEIKFTNLNLKDFACKMGGFVHLVDFWSCALGMLVAKCKNHKIRRNIVRNLTDENCQELTHVETYFLFLTECASSEPPNKDYNKSQFGDELDVFLKKTEHNEIIEKYKDLLQKFIETKSFDDACQMLGGIEYTYHLISEDINAFFMTHKGGVLPVHHYTVHEVLDTQHAIDLTECSTSPVNQENLLIGGQWIVGVINELLLLQSS